MVFEAVVCLYRFQTLFTPKASNRCINNRIMHLIIFSCVGVSAGFLLYADCRLLLILRIRQRRIFIKHTVPRRSVTDLQGVFTAIAHLSVLFNRFGVFAILECFILQPTFLIIIYLDKTVIYPRFSVQLDLISLEIFVIKCPFEVHR